MTEQEVRAGLYAAGRLKSHTATSLVQTGLGVLGFAMFAANIYSNPAGIFNYIVCVLCLLLIAVSWIGPARTERRVIRRAVGGQVISLKIYPDRVRGGIQGESVGWEIPLDGQTPLSSAPGILVLHLDSGQLLVVPERAFDESGRETAAGYIRQGTRARLKK